MSAQESNVEDKIVEIVDGEEVAKKKKRKRKKKKSPEDAENEALAKQMEEKMRLQAAFKQIFAAPPAPSTDGPAHSHEEAIKKEYKFWDTQPVVQLNEEVTEYAQIEPDKEDIQQTPYTVNANFEWVVIDVLDKNELEEVYHLLSYNYVEDEDCMFRFDYSPAFLLWALTPPGWKKQWHIGLRVKSSRKLVAFISAIPATVTVGTITEQHMVEINFLCVLRKIRDKRVAAVLIKEITRRVHLEGLFTAAYTAGIYLPTPYVSCRYWHRTLNAKKLIDVQFSFIPRNETLQDVINKHKLPKEPKTIGFKLMEERHLEEAHKLLTDYLDEKTEVHPVYTLEEFRHWFLGRDNVITSMVVEDPETGRVTDFASFYALNSSVINHPVHKDLRAAYSYYNVARKTPFNQLLKDVLITAVQLKFDVFNALDLMENEQMFEPLKFGKGDGCLQFYFYNIRLPKIEPKQTGLVLL